MAGLRWPESWPTWGRIRLRAWSERDLPLIAELSTDPYVPLIGTVPSPYTEAGGRAYVERQHRRLVDGTGWSFAVEELTTGSAVGGAGLIRHDDRPASGGYVIAPSRRGEGLASAALHALTAFGWSVGLERIELFIEPGNLSSIATAERCGYLPEVLLPAHLEIGGRFRDMLLYAAAPSAAPRP